MNNRYTKTDNFDANYAIKDGAENEPKWQAVALDNIPVEAIVSLLAGSLSNIGVTRKSSDFWCWKHTENPFGVSLGLAARSIPKGDLVGIRPMMRWRFLTESGDELDVVRAVDTVTHPEWRGLGLFKQLTQQTLQQLAVDINHQNTFVFNTPNKNSLPGYMKMGWSSVKKLKILGRVVDFWSLPRWFVHLLKYPAEQVCWSAVSRGSVLPGSRLSDNQREHIFAFAADCERRRPVIGMRTKRTEKYLSWRYMKQPNVEYGLVRSFAANGKLTALAVLRLDQRKLLLGAVITELFVAEYTQVNINRLIGCVIRDLKVSYLIAHFAEQSLEYKALQKCYFRPVKNMQLVARLCKTDAAANPLQVIDLQKSHWDFTFSELEVF
ncbi:MAG: GNAT family N-acetyltransferase [Pseudomonadales bacterium]|nr:GNAT family N-acetyltransferase [Pseudomonadales bacterium]